MAGRPNRGASASPPSASADAPVPPAPSAPPAPAGLIELGVLRGAFGIRGWCHVLPHSPEAEVLRATRRWWLAAREGTRELAPRPVRITAVRSHGAALVAKFEGCDQPEPVEALRGARVLVAREDFPPAPEGEYYWVDLVGMQVVNRAGTTLGVVTGLRDNGVHDVLELSGPDATQILIPMVAAYVDAVDAEARCIRVDWEADW